MTVHYASGLGSSQYLEGARVGENLYIKPQETSCVSPRAILFSTSCLASVCEG